MHISGSFFRPLLSPTDQSVEENEEREFASYSSIVPVITVVALAALALLNYSDYQPTRAKEKLKAVASTALEAAKIYVEVTCLIIEIFFDSLLKIDTTPFSENEEAIEVFDTSSFATSLQQRLQQWFDETGRPISDEELLFALLYYYIDSSAPIELRSSEMTALPDVFDLFPEMKELRIEMDQLVSLPETLLKSSSLTKLELVRCGQLERVSLRQMSSLERLKLKNCSKLRCLEAPPSLKMLKQKASPVTIYDLPQGCEIDSDHLLPHAVAPLLTKCTLLAGYDPVIGINKQFARGVFELGARGVEESTLQLQSLYRKDRKVEVIRACDREKSKRVVLKVFESADKASYVFARLQRMRSCLEPSAVKYFGFPVGVLDGDSLEFQGLGASALIYEDYDLGDMETLIAGGTSRTLSLDLKSKAAQRFLLGLDALHKATVVHHDIKPRNLLFRDQDRLEAVIGDFDGYVSKKKFRMTIIAEIQKLILEHCKRFNEQVREEKERLFDEIILPKLSQTLFNRFPYTPVFVASSLRKAQLEDLKSSKEIQDLKELLFSNVFTEDENSAWRNVAFHELSHTLFQEQKLHDIASMGMSIISLFLNEYISGATYHFHSAVSKKMAAISIIRSDRLKNALLTKGLNQEQCEGLLSLVAPYCDSYRAQPGQSFPNLSEIAKLFSTEN